jgi:hypothetical protein
LIFGLVGGVSVLLVGWQLLSGGTAARFSELFESASLKDVFERRFSEMQVQDYNGDCEPISLFNSFVAAPKPLRQWRAGFMPVIAIHFKGENGLETGHGVFVIGIERAAQLGKDGRAVFTLTIYNSDTVLQSRLHIVGGNSSDKWLRTVSDSPLFGPKEQSQEFELTLDGYVVFKPAA